ncbi:hypothetical protein D3C71_1916920 [compost metagenome]
MSYRELEGYCHIKDTLDANGSIASSFDEDMVAELLESSRHLARYAGPFKRMHGEAIALVTDRWENRPIGDFLAFRGQQPTL